MFQHTYLTCALVTTTTLSAATSAWAADNTAVLIQFDGTTKNIGTGILTFTPGNSASTTSQLQVTGTASLPNTIQIAPGFTAEFNPTDTLTLTGPVQDVSSGGNLAIADFSGGTVVLSNATYTGTTTVGLFSTLATLNDNALSPHSAHIVDGLLTTNNGVADTSNQIFSLAGGGQVILGSGNLAIVGTDHTVFSGTLSGNGSILLQGGELGLTGDNSAFTGPVTISEGALLNLNGNLGGSLSIKPTSTISGSGSINLYTQAANTTYIVEINGAGQSDQIHVTGTPGTAVLSGGTVVVTPHQGIDFGAKYEIVRAAGGVRGKFDNVVAADPLPLFIPTLNYSEPNAVYLSIQPAIINGAVSFNEQQVARQLDSSTKNDTNTQIKALLNALIALDPLQVTEALDQLDGDPYTKDPFIVGTINRQFIRRLYDPIRPLVTTSPLCRCAPECNYGVDLWVEGGWNRSFLQNDGNAFGFKLNGWETTLGAQKTFCDLFTLGVAGSYEHDFVHYNLSSSGKLSSGFVGLYALYRPEEFYVLTDLAFGYTNNRIQRSIEIGPLSYATKGNPNIYDITVYGECGLDVPSTYVLIQPFVGIEASCFWRPQVTESGAGGLSLNIFKRCNGNATGRLGLHITTVEVCTLSLSLDGAWNYRLTSDYFTYNQQFVGFGTPFTLQGVRINRNSGEAAATLVSQIDDNWRLWTECGGEVWRNGSNLFLTTGVQASF